MTDMPSRKGRVGLSIELLLLSLVLLSVGLVARIYFTYGYLPAPYFYDVNDTYMDWFNPAYWANHPGAYDIWRTVYPPLSFVFLRLFSLKSCYAADPYFGRSCDWLGMIAIWLSYFASLYFVFKSYRVADPRTVWIRTLAIGLGLPMLYTLERGNLILPCFLFFVLATGRVLRSVRLKWLAVALTVNFKPYLVVMLAAHLIRRRWRWLEGAAIAILAVYLLTFALEGAGSPEEIVRDITAFAFDIPNSFVLSEAFYSTSFAPIIHLIENDFPLVGPMGSRAVEALGIVLPLLIHIGQAGTLLAMIAALVSRKAIPLSRLSALSVALLITTTDPGGYTQLFLVFLVFFEPWRGPSRITMLICAYLLSLSADFPLSGIEHHLRDVYLTKRTVDYTLSVYLGEFLRPLLILSIEYCLITVTLGDWWSARASAPKNCGGGELAEAVQTS